MPALTWMNVVAAFIFGFAFGFGWHLSGRIFR